MARDGKTHTTRSILRHTVASSDERSKSAPLFLLAAMHSGERGILGSQRYFKRSAVSLADTRSTSSKRSGRSRRKSIPPPPPRRLRRRLRFLIHGWRQRAILLFVCFLKRKKGKTADTVCAPGAGSASERYEKTPGNKRVRRTSTSPARLALVFFIFLRPRIYHVNTNLAPAFFCRLLSLPVGITPLPLPPPPTPSSFLLACPLAWKHQPKIPPEMLFLAHTSRSQREPFFVLFPASWWRATCKDAFFIIYFLK